MAADDRLYEGDLADMPKAPIRIMCPNCNTQKPMCPKCGWYLCVNPKCWGSKYEVCECTAKDIGVLFNR